MDHAPKLMEAIKKYIPWTIALIAIIAAIYSWYKPAQEYIKYIEVTKFQSVPRNIYIKDCQVEGTGDVINNQPVTATSKKVDCPKEGSVSISTTITPSDGKTHIYVTPKKPSLFAFIDQKEIGGRYGLTGQVDVYGRWSFLRIGSFYTSIYAEANSKSEANIMLEVSYRF